MKLNSYVVAGIAKALAAHEDRLQQAIRGVRNARVQLEACELDGNLDDCVWFSGELNAYWGALQKYSKPMAYCSACGYDFYLFKGDWLDHEEYKRTLSMLPEKRSIPNRHNRVRLGADGDYIFRQSIFTGNHRR